MTTEQPQHSANRASKGFEFAWASLCTILVAVAIGHFAYAEYLLQGGTCGGWCALSLATDWVIIILVGTLLLLQIRIMGNKMSGVQQYYYCVAGIVVALIALGMTAAQAGYDINESVKNCAGGGCYANETNGVIVPLEYVLFGLSIALVLLAILRMYRVQKNAQQTPKVVTAV